MFVVNISTVYIRFIASLQIDFSLSVLLLCFLVKKTPYIKDKLSFKLNITLKDFNILTFHKLVSHFIFMRHAKCTLLKKFFYGSHKYRFTQNKSYTFYS